MTDCPTVGRIVHFYRTSPAAEGPFPMIIVVASEDGVVSGHVFKTEGSTEYVEDVTFAAGASTYWVWPPRN